MLDIHRLAAPLNGDFTALILQKEKKTLQNVKYVVILCANTSAKSSDRTHGIDKILQKHLFAE